MRRPADPLSPGEHELMDGPSRRGEATVAEVLKALTAAPVRNRNRPAPETIAGGKDVRSYAPRREGHMDELLFFSVFGGAVATALGFALAWISARSRANRLEDRLTGMAAGPDQSHLEARLNELAAQVEELARSQDFLHRLITRRLERLPPPVERPREITPH